MQTWRTTRDVVAGSADIESLQQHIAAHGSVDTPDGRGCTPVMLACLGGRSDVLKVLLDANAKLDNRSTAGDTALSLALCGCPASGHLR